MKWASRENGGRGIRDWCFPVREEKLDWRVCRIKTRIFVYLFDRLVLVFNERNDNTYRLMTMPAGDGRIAGAGERGRGLSCVWRGRLCWEHCHL